jgi:hypothetical protein
VGEVDDRFTPMSTDPALSRKALATVLWPSWAYMNERYALPKPAAAGK